MNTYHPLDWSLFVVGNSAAFPLAQEVVKVPPPEWWTLPQLNTPFTQVRAIAPVLTVPRRSQECAQSPIVPANYQGYYQIGPYRGFFLVSSLTHDQIIGPVIERFPPGAQDWPNDIKPQFRVPEEMQRPAAAEPVLPDCPVPPIDDEDSRTDRSDWPIFKHASVKLKGLDLLVRPGQPAIAASVVAKVKGTTAVVDTGDVRVIASLVVKSLQDLKSLFDLKSVVRFPDPVVVPVRPPVVVVKPQPTVRSVVAQLSGIGIEVRSGSITALVGPDLQVEEDEELLFLLEVA